MPPVAVPAATAPRAQVGAKLLRYARWVIDRYDSNRDGLLQSDEWRAMRGTPTAIDANRDGLITIDEYAQFVADYGAGRAFRLSTIGTDVASAPGGARGENAAGSDDPNAREPATAPTTQTRRDTKFNAVLPAGVPPWFAERDADGDGQLSLAEFSPKLPKTEVDEFNRYDLNRDGVLTPQEYLRAGSQSKAKAGKNSP